MLVYDAEITIKGITSYGANAMIPDNVPDNVKIKPSDETWENYMVRVLPHTVHINEKSGNLFIPSNALSLCIKRQAQFDGMKVPHRGSMTFGSVFGSGIGVRTPIEMPFTVEDLVKRLKGQSVPADGRRGGTKRVTRYFWWLEPDEWGGTFKVTIFNALITPKIFKETVENAGRITGLGMYRPENKGEHGVFDVTQIKFSSNAPKD